MLNLYHHKSELVLESGARIESLSVAYHTYGTYQKGITPVIWVCHALTASADVADWWANLFGEENVFDPTRNFIVCVNNLGSPYGTSSPISIAADGAAYEKRFPKFTIRDMVQVQEILRSYLELEKIDALIGGSQGAQQCMEWAIDKPDLISKLVLIATNAKHSEWGIAFNEAQRMAIDAGALGLAVARAIAMLSYRNYTMYKQTHRPDDTVWQHGAASYQQYQGRKLADRFDANCYYRLSQAMDSHDVSRGRGSIANALSQITANTLIIGISSDLLFPIEEQQLLASHIRNSVLVIIDSPYGHDGFLTEGEKLKQLIIPFLNSFNK